jgi:type IV secretory pathway TraG/TraD family ATPase VirD4
LSYGEDKTHSLLSGLSTIVAFRVNDGAMREYIKGLHGKNRKKEVY